MAFDACLHAGEAADMISEIHRIFDAFTRSFPDGGQECLTNHHPAPSQGNRSTSSRILISCPCLLQAIKPVFYVFDPTGWCINTGGQNEALGSIQKPAADLSLA